MDAGNIHTRHNPFDGAKEQNMGMEYKVASVNGLKVLDADEGLVETIVSVTGLRDNVNDIIEPGAYEKSLKVRTPKGVWHHNWHESVSRTERIKELLPGDPELPETLPNGDPWPTGAGALKVSTRFNLKTTRGKDAYEDVVFFGDQQEWSIGYNVPVGGATTDSKTGIRSIKTLDLYEYSPVLFGAMSSARTTSVKEAQRTMQEVKSLHGDEAQKFLMEVKSFGFDMDVKGDDPRNDEEEIGDEEEEYVEEWEDEEEEKAALGAVGADVVVAAIKALNDLLDAAQAPQRPSHVERKAAEADDGDWDMESKSLADLVDDAEMDAEMSEKAAAFDEAYDAGDVEAMEAAATPLLDGVQDGVDAGGDNQDGLREVAGYIVKAFQEVDGDGGDQADSEAESVDDSASGEAKALGFVNDYEVDYQFKRDFSPKRRQEAAGKGHALPDGSFPIEDETDLKNAISAFGRAKDKEACKSHILKRAKALGKMDLIPDSWSKKSADQQVETKAIQVDLSQFADYLN